MPWTAATTSLTPTSTQFWNGLNGRVDANVGMPG